MNVSIHNKAKALAAFAVATCAVLASATTYYVKPDGDDTAAGTSWDTALKTAAAGISKVNNNNQGHHVVFWPGTYTLTDAIGCTGGYSGLPPLPPRREPCA